VGTEPLYLRHDVGVAVHPHFIARHVAGVTVVREELTDFRVVPQGVSKNMLDLEPIENINRCHRRPRPKAGSVHDISSSLGTLQTRNLNAHFALFSALTRTHRSRRRPRHQFITRHFFKPNPDVHFAFFRALTSASPKKKVSTNCGSIHTSGPTSA